MIRKSRQNANKLQLLRSAQCFCKVIYFEISNNQIINQQILADFTLTQDLAGQIKPILEINPPPINMLENGFFTVAINNNNNPGNIKNLSIYINTEEI